MKSEWIFVGIGILLMIGLPLLCSKYGNVIRNHSVERRLISYLTCLAISVQAEAHGNHELFVGFILGSSLFRLLIFEGMNRCFSSEGRSFYRNEVFSRGLPAMDEEGQREKGRRYYFAFSVIMVLLLSADYLFSKKAISNQISRLDGGLLLLLFLIFLYTEGKGKLVLYKENVMNGRFLQTLAEIPGKLRTWIYVGILCIGIFSGSYFLVDGLIGICMESGVRFSLAGVLFLSWAAQAGNIFFRREKEAEEELLTSTASETTFFYLLAFGLGAAVLPIHVTYEMILHFLIMSGISILLVWKEKVRGAAGGSLMLTLYMAGVILFVMV